MSTFPRVLRGRGVRPVSAEPRALVDDEFELPLMPCNSLRAQWHVGASGRPELTWAVAGLDDPPGVTHLPPRLEALFPDEVRRSA